MNIATSNPMMKTANDKFDEMFGESVPPQILTAKAMVDSFFGSIVKVRKPTDGDKLDEAVLLVRKVEAICAELKYKLPSPSDAAIIANQDLLHEVLSNLAAARMHLYALENEPFVPCDCGGKCDDCVAGRSDEHFNRKRDGKL